MDYFVKADDSGGYRSWGVHNPRQESLDALEDFFTISKAVDQDRKKGNDEHTYHTQRHPFELDTKSLSWTVEPSPLATHSNTVILTPRDLAMHDYFNVEFTRCSVKEGDED